jgi:hypothetical protein
MCGPVFFIFRGEFNRRRSVPQLPIHYQACRQLRPSLPQMPLHILIQRRAASRDDGKPRSCDKNPGRECKLRGKSGLCRLDG